MDLTSAERRILLHSLGLDQRSAPFRNFYVASGAALSMCNGLAGQGYLVRSADATNLSTTFICTAAGAAAIGATLPE